MRLTLELSLNCLSALPLFSRHSANTTSSLFKYLPFFFYFGLIAPSALILESDTFRRKLNVSVYSLTSTIICDLQSRSVSSFDSTCFRTISAITNITLPWLDIITASLTILSIYSRHIIAHRSYLSFALTAIVHFFEHLRSRISLTKKCLRQ